MMNKKGLVYLIGSEIMCVWLFVSIYKELYTQAVIAGVLMVSFGFLWVFQRQRALKEAHNMAKDKQ
jgi:type III secretory pathway component EscU